LQPLEFLKGEEGLKAGCIAFQYRLLVVMNKCFLLNPEKNLAQIRLVVLSKKAPLIPKNDVTEPKARLLYQLKSF